MFPAGGGIFQQEN